VRFFGGRFYLGYAACFRPQTMVEDTEARLTAELMSWRQERDFPFSRVQSLYDAVLKSSLRKRLARYTHAMGMILHSIENTVIHPPFGSANAS
jgi:hypothetical protein